MPPAGESVRAECLYSYYGTEKSLNPKSRDKLFKAKPFGSGYCLVVCFLFGFI